MWRFVLAVVLVLACVRPSSAWACSCAPGGQVFPKEGTLPPNVTFYAAKGHYRQLVLREGHGDVTVPLQVQEVGDDILRIRPSTPLENGKRYTLEVDPKLTKGSGYKPEPLADFEVQGAPDTQPPRPPSAVDVDYEHSIVNRWSSCETEEEGYTVSTEGASDDRVPAGKLATVVVPEGDPERVLALLPPGKDFIGHTTCFYNFDVDKAQGTRVALRSVDTAGNLSAPAPAIRLAQGTPLWVATLLQILRHKAVLAVIVLGAIGAILVVVKRAPREARPQ